MGLIVVNHALNEMCETALSYLIARAERMLNKDGMLLSENFGAGYLRKSAQTVQMFESRKWTAMPLEDASFAFVPPGRTPPIRKPDEMPTRTWADSVDLMRQNLVRRRIQMMNLQIFWNAND